MRSPWFILAASQLQPISCLTLNCKLWPAFLNRKARSFALSYVTPSSPNKKSWKWPDTHSTWHQSSITICDTVVLEDRFQACLFNTTPGTSECPKIVNSARPVCPVKHFRITYHEQYTGCQRSLLGQMNCDENSIRARCWWARSIFSFNC